MNKKRSSSLSKCNREKTLEMDKFEHILWKESNRVSVHNTVVSKAILRIPCVVTSGTSFQRGRGRQRRGPRCEREGEHPNNPIIHNFFLKESLF